MQDNGSSTGFLGRRFKSCPSCGELIGSDSLECRFCKSWLGPHDPSARGVPSRPPSTYTPIQPHPSTYASPPPPARVGPRLCHTAEGDRIPPEYGPGFDPHSFCWPAFWFADLWHADKGLLPDAMKHFRLRIVSTFLGVFAFIIVAGAGTSARSSRDAQLGFGISLMVIWFATLLASAVLAFVDAQTAHGRYIDFFNKSALTGFYSSAKNLAIAVYWRMLFAPFAVFLVGFIAMLAVMS